MTLLARSAIPAPLAHYSDCRETLRRDFWYSCAYCTLTEMEASGVSFEIDHYEPQSTHAHLANDYANLMWSCKHCNQAKKAHPSPRARAAGFEFFRPDEDEAAEHFDVTENTLVGLTKLIGEYTETMLRLNRFALKQVRSVRRELYESREAMLEGVRALAKIPDSKVAPKLRPQLAEARQLVQALSVAAGEAKAEMIKDFSRSIHVDPPTAQDEQARRSRSRYLREIERAVVPPAK